MSAPIPFTCPYIDNIQEMAVDVERASEVLRKTWDYLYSELQGRNSLIESIRDANSRLREWGEELEEELREAHEEIAALEKELDELRYRMESLEK